MKNQSKYTRILLAISCAILLSCNQKVEKGFADINGTSIYYEIKGEGVPVILMHGFALDTRAIGIKSGNSIYREFTNPIDDINLEDDS